LLVEFPLSLDDLPVKLKTNQLTSIVAVPRESGICGERPLSTTLLPSFIRVPHAARGYLLFTKLGQVYHVPDEAIIPAEAAWQEPGFGPSSLKHQVITFKLLDAVNGSVVRVCTVAALQRYEYFAKLLGQWQEGASAEVEVPDAQPHIFDLLLTFVYTGKVRGNVGLDLLTGLIALANKYLMYDLVAVSLLHIYSILEDGQRMREQQASVLADLLTLANTATACCPTLLKKVVFAVLSHQPEVVIHPEFLRQVASQTSGFESICLLLGPLVDDGPYTFDRNRRKRRKQELYGSLWSTFSSDCGRLAWHSS